MNKLTTSFYRDHQVYLFAILTSLLLSLLLGYRNAIINPDGICYVLGAQMMGSASISDAMHFCPQLQWPFYSTLIYALGQITHLSYAVSAHLINGLLSLISVVTFIKIVEELGGNQRVAWLAALVILFDHQFNLLRDNIIRDHGFWAFYLMSIYLLLRYFSHPRGTTALLWNASLIVATLFRIEGAIFLLAMPFCSWLVFQASFNARAKMFFTLNSPLILGIMVFTSWQFFHPEQIMQHLGRVNEVIHQLQNGLTILLQRYHSVREAMIQNILPLDSLPDAGVLVFLVWISWYVYNVVLTLSFAYAAFLLYAWRNHIVSLAPRYALVIFGMMAINVLMTLGFLGESMFVSKRYLMALTLVLMIWVPFAVDDLIDKWASMRHRIFLCVMTLFFLMSAVSGVVEFGRSKFFIRTAGNWMANEIPASAALYVNDFQLMYYSGHFGMHIFEVMPMVKQVDKVTGGKWKQYDYLALRLRKNGNDQMSPLLKELIGMTPMKIFSDKHGNRVAVYKLHENKSYLEARR